MEHPAGLVQGIHGTPAPMVEFLPGAPAALIESIPGQVHDVEGIHDRGCVWELFSGGAFEPGEAIHRDDLNALAPRVGLGSQPGFEDPLGSARDHIQKRACQFFCVWGLEVGGDSVGVGGGELGEGLFPVGGGVSLDEAGVSCSFVGGFASVCEALGGAFVFDVADGEPQEFDGGFFAGEMPAVLGDFTQLVVQRFDSVGGVHDAAQHGRER